MTSASLLRIAHLSGARAPTVETDPYIPLQVRWVEPALRRGPPPVYIRMSGPSGGELELRVDRTSGALLVLTVLSLGRRCPSLQLHIPPPRPSSGVDL